MKTCWLTTRMIRLLLVPICFLLFDRYAIGISYTYDGNNNLLSTTDAQGNITKITYTLGHATSLTYDAIGRLLSINDANAHTVSVSYDANSRLKKILNPLAHETKFGYDSVGNLIQITDANSNSTQYVYDENGNLTSVQDALGNVTSYSYDVNYNLTKINDVNERMTTYSYDAANLALVSITIDPIDPEVHFLTDTSDTSAMIWNPAGWANLNELEIGLSYLELYRESDPSFLSGASVTSAGDAVQLTHVDIRHSWFSPSKAIFLYRQNIPDFPTISVTAPYNEPSVTVTVTGIGTAGTLVGRVRGNTATTTLSGPSNEVGSDSGDLSAGLALTPVMGEIRLLRRGYSVLALEGGKV